MRPSHPRREPLTERNWLLYAARNYQNPQSCGTDEFKRDLKMFKYVKKAITRYEATGELKERLVLNHLTTLCNLFGPEPMVRLVFLKMPNHLSYVVPFLLTLSVMPDIVRGVGKEGKDYHLDDITLNQGVIDALRGI
jgi:hypothetical protein